MKLSPKERRALANDIRIALMYMPEDTLTKRDLRHWLDVLVPEEDWK